MTTTFYYKTIALSVLSSCILQLSLAVQMNNCVQNSEGSGIDIDEGGSTPVTGITVESLTHRIYTSCNFASSTKNGVHSQDTIGYLYITTAVFVIAIIIYAVFIGWKSWWQNRAYKVTVVAIQETSK